MNDSDFFKVPNEITECRLFNQKPYSKAAALVDLYRQRSFAEHDTTVAGHHVHLMVDDIPCAVRGLGLAWGWPKSSVARFLRECVRCGILSKKRDGKRDGQVSVYNMPLHGVRRTDDNEVGTENGTPFGTAMGQQRDSNGTAKGHSSRKEDGEDGTEPPGAGATSVPKHAVKLGNIWYCTLHEKGLRKEYPLDPDGTCPQAYDHPRPHDPYSQQRGIKL